MVAFTIWLSGILLSMADPVWGLLPKAQDDPQTINEAITAAIAAHEADPTAHLGDGESLEQHRINGIIDHPQGSVAGDKFTNTEFVFMPAFESKDLYTISATGADMKPGGIRFDTGSTNNTRRYMTTNGQYAPLHYYPDQDVTFQTSLYLSSDTHQEVYAVAGSLAPGDGAPNVGFKIVDSLLYGLETAWEESGNTEYTTLLGAVDNGITYILRVQVVAADNKAYFYVDGDLLGELTLHANDDDGLSLISYSIKNTAAEQKIMVVGAPYLSIKRAP